MVDRWRARHRTVGGTVRGRRPRAGGFAPLVMSALLGLVLVGGLLAVVLPALPATAKGDDVCPERNDTFQAACFLGTASDALGFISHPNDIDAYRFEVYDYAATVRVSLPDRPHPYRLNVADWNGEVIAGGEGIVQTALPLPGSYYVFVDSPAGQFDDGTPYRIEYAVTYRSQPAPTRIYSSEFRGGPADFFGATGTNTHADEFGEYTISGGRITLAMSVSGTPEEPAATDFFLPPDPPDPGPLVDDFTMTIDTRVEGAPDAGYKVLFRYLDGDNFYQIEVSLQDQVMILSKIVDAQLVNLTDWTHAPSIRTEGVNRTIVRFVGDEVRVNINGADVAAARDGAISRGLIGFGALTYGPPPTVHFDNILVTTPTRR